MTPRISIVTTVYDRVSDLRRCLRSTQHLAYRDFEQIVVSDHPPFETLCAIGEACAEAGVRHLNLPARTNNWGIGPAQAGLREARGEFVCFLSDDNAYLPDHFGPLLEALDADPALGFAYSSCKYAGRAILCESPAYGRIDLGQPLFRRSVLGDALPFNEFAWDWRLIDSLLARGVRWRHVDVLSFIFRLQFYPEHMEALA